MALEQPKYSVIRRVGPVEIRAYAGFSVAEVEVKNTDIRSASSSAFGRLFSYITGSNSTAQKIAMTTPVRQVPAENGWRVSFVVPSEIVAGGVPVPNDSRITITEVPAGTYAVLRYSGFWNEAKFEKQAALLRSILNNSGIEVVGPAIGAVYNPPITPPPLRRNEVMVAVNI